MTLLVVTVKQYEVRILTLIVLITCCKDSKTTFKTEIGHTVHELLDLLFYVND